MFLDRGCLALVFILVCTRRFGSSYDEEEGWSLRIVDGVAEFDGRPEVRINGFFKPICDEYVTPEVAMVICRELGFSPLNVTMKHGQYNNKSSNNNNNNNNNTNRASLFRCSGDEQFLMSECNWAAFPMDTLCQSQDGITCNGNIRLAHGFNATQGNVQVYRAGRWTGICDHQARATTAGVVCRQMGYDSDSAILYTDSYFGPGIRDSRYITCTGDEISHELCRYLEVADPSSCDEDHNLAVDCYGRLNHFGAALLFDVFDHDLDGVDVPLRGYTEVYLAGDDEWGIWCDDVAMATTDELQQMKNIAAVICVEEGFSRFNPQFANLAKRRPIDPPMLSINAMTCTGQEERLDQCVRTGSWLSGEPTCNVSQVVFVRCEKLIQLTNGTSNSNGRLEFTEERFGSLHPLKLTIIDPSFAKVACRQLGFESTNYALRYGNSFGRSDSEALPYVYTCAGDEAIIQDCQRQPSVPGEDEEYGHIGVDCQAPPIIVTTMKTLSETELVSTLGDIQGDVLVVQTGGSDWALSCVHGTDQLDTATTGVLCHSLGYSRFRSGYSTIQLENSGDPRNDILTRVKCKGTEENITECSLNVGERSNVTCDLAVILQCQERGTCPTSAIQPEKQDISCYSYCIGLMCLNDVTSVQCSLDNGGGCAIQKMYSGVSFDRISVQEHGFCTDHCKPEFIEFMNHLRTYQCCYGDGCNDPVTTALRKSERVRLGHGREPSLGPAQVFVGATWKYVQVDDRPITEPFLKMVCWEAGFSGGNVILMKGFVSPGEPRVSITDYESCVGIGTASCPYRDVGNGDGNIGNDGIVLAVDCNARSPKMRLVDGASPNIGRLEVMFNDTWGTVCDEGFTPGTADLVCRSLGYSGGCSVSSVQEPSMAHFRSGQGHITFSKLSCQGDEENIKFCDYDVFNSNQSSCTHEQDVGIICETGPPIEPTTGDMTAGVDGGTPQTTSLTCAIGTCADDRCARSKVSMVRCTATRSYCFREQSKSLTGSTYFRYGCKTTNCNSGTSKGINNEDVTTFCCTSAMCNTRALTDDDGNVIANNTDVITNKTTGNFGDIEVTSGVGNVYGVSGLSLVLFAIRCGYELIA